MINFDKNGIAKVGKYDVRRTISGDMITVYKDGEHVAALPINAESLFLRSARGQNVLDPIAPLIEDVRAGRVLRYQDVTRRGGTPSPR